MRRRLAAAALLAAALAATAGPPGAAARRSTVSIPGPGGLALPAALELPSTPGRHPAVVLLHGCSGLHGTSGRPQSHVDRWLRTLAGAGFVAVAVDSFGPRGVETVCGVPPERSGVSEVLDRPRDAFAALTWLRGRADVAPRRVGVLGWSNGASATLAAVGAGGTGVPSPPAAGGFAVAVAYYPGCGLRGAFGAPASGRYRPRVPLQVFTASRDPLATDCEARARVARSSLLGLRRYEGAGHSFDDSSRGTAADARARASADRVALALLRSRLAR